MSKDDRLGKHEVMGEELAWEVFRRSRPEDPTHPWLAYDLSAQPRALQVIQAAASRRKVGGDPAEVFISLLYDSQVALILEDSIAMVPECSGLSQSEFMALQFEGGGYEYVHGELVPFTSGDGRRSEAWGEILGQVYSHVKAKKLGRVLMDILTYLDDQGEVRYFPAIAFLAHDGPGTYDGTKFIGPTLVVEVTSPDSNTREETEKKDNYFRYGVEWYWIVNTVTGVTEEYRAATGGYELISQTAFTAAFRPQLFPGLEITIAEG